MPYIIWMCLLSALVVHGFVSILNIQSLFISFVSIGGKNGHYYIWYMLCTYVLGNGLNVYDWTWSLFLVNQELSRYIWPYLLLYFRHIPLY